MRIRNREDRRERERVDNKKEGEIWRHEIIYFQHFFHHPLLLFLGHLHRYWLVWFSTVLFKCHLQTILISFIQVFFSPSSNPLFRFSDQINCSILGLGFQHNFQQHTCVSTILEFSNNNMLMHNPSAYFVLLRKIWQLFHNAIRFLDSFLL